ncbi:hypothetical protein HDU79_007511 [Rhizoclosmatium sp. JEL0117]|nr:hypothetical protein HDU79_007511 [Rhizoclosmatium sp. JEL0117]
MNAPVSSFPRHGHGGQEHIETLRATFTSQKTKRISWRKDQLFKLHSWIVEHNNLISEAVRKDLHKSDAAIALELTQILNEAADAFNNLDDWTKAETTLNNSVKVVREARGLVLIVGTWDFALQSVLLPLISAIAAGNCVAVKTSDLTPNTSLLLSQSIPRVLDNDAIKLLNLDLPQILNTLKFDLIYFSEPSQLSTSLLSNSASVNQDTPVIQLQSGKSVAYVHSDAIIEATATRIAYAKFGINCGQSSTAPSYVLVHTASYPRPIESTAYGRIINRTHLQYLQTTLTNQLALPHSKLEFGGESDLTHLFLEPTVVSGVTLTDPLMQYDLNGPILPILEVGDVFDAARIIRERGSTPVTSIYTQTPRLTTPIFETTHSGTLIVNDSYIQQPHVYSGKEGFLAFTYPRKVIWESNGWMTELFRSVFRYPPFAARRDVIEVVNRWSRKRLDVGGWRRFVALFLPKLWKIVVVYVAFWIGKSVGEEDGWGGVLDRIRLILP